MASRMDRYYKSELVDGERSSKNKNLYKTINDLDTYSSVEGVANIENSNEIDISKVREMLRKRDEAEKRKRVTPVQYDDSSIDREETLDEIKSYDINNVLNKVRENSAKEKYRSLDSNQYQALKNAKTKQNSYNVEEEQDELKELIKTLHATKALKNLDNDVGLLDELKSDTMVGDAQSIKSIINEEKKNLSDVKEEIDDSFYTKSFGFTSSDFDELKDINHKIKKGNKFIIILLVVLILLVGAIAGIVFLPKLLP